LKISRINNQRVNPKWPNYCWTFWSLGLLAKGNETRVPTQITCQTFKEHPKALRLREKGGQRSPSYTPSNQASTHELTARTASRPRLRGGAQYSPRGGLVNALSQ